MARGWSTAAFLGHRCRELRNLCPPQALREVCWSTWGFLLAQRVLSEGWWGFFEIILGLDHQAACVLSGFLRGDCSYFIYVSVLSM